ncbi:hypothetical protein LguiA_019309 [Lonicera macranthoides]
MAMAVVISLLLVFAAPAAFAVDHVVGGNSGWTNSGDYTSWAAGQTFRVGDNLLFNYGSTHSVDEVGQTDYTGCTSSNVLNSYTGGQNTIALTKTGPMYFICPTFGHCGQGMKLAINVVAAGTTPATPSPTSPSGSTPPGTSTPPSTPTPTTRSPPSPSAAAGVFGNMNQFVLGFSLVLAPVVAFMV